MDCLFGIVWPRRHGVVATGLLTTDTYGAQTWNSWTGSSGRNCSYAAAHQLTVDYTYTGILGFAQLLGGGTGVLFRLFAITIFARDGEEDRGKGVIVRLFLILLGTEGFA